MDVYVLGSAFLELFPKRIKERIRNSREFTGTAGGSATNTVVAISKLGVKAGLISGVGKDEIGKLVLNNLRKYNVNTKHVQMIEKMKTGVSFYEYAKGKKVYYFYRFSGYSDPENSIVLDEKLLKDISKAKVFHFTEAVIRNEQMRKNVIEFTRKLRDENVTIFYDSNLRLNLWKSKEEAVSASKEIMKNAKIITMNEEESNIIFGTSEIKKVAEELSSEDEKEIFIKRGRRGCIGYKKNEVYKVDAFKVKVVDDTGAGDCFSAGIIVGKIKKLEMEETMLLANAVAAIKISRVGGIDAIPNLNEVKRFLRNRGYESLAKKI